MKDPKTEASDLFNSLKGFRVKYSHTKKCAKICVNKILEAMPKTIAIDGYGPAQFKNPDIEYWEEVLNELEKK